MDTAGVDFGEYPDALSSPSWADVKTVYLQADEAGRTSSYVEEVQREQVVAQFYIDEKDELNRRVGGAAQYAAKQKKECDVELSGPTSYALGPSPCLASRRATASGVVAVSSRRMRRPQAGQVETSIWKTCRRSQAQGLRRGGSASSVPSFRKRASCWRRARPPRGSARPRGGGRRGRRGRRSSGRGGSAGVG